MVQVNGFALAIINDGEQDKLKRDDGDYVALDNNTEYKLKLSNFHGTDCMVDVYIEDDKVGTWFIPSNDSIVIERPADTYRKFTFVKETAYQARQAGVIAGVSTNGLIKVVFFPKKQIPIVMTSRYESMARPTPLSIKSYQNGVSQSFRPASPVRTSMASSPRSFRSPSRYESGATILGDVSHQQFGTRMRFRDDEIDWSNKTTITIRLVARSYDYRSYDYRPYVSIGNRHENTYPQRIDW